MHQFVQGVEVSKKALCEKTVYFIVLIEGYIFHKLFDQTFSQNVAFGRCGEVRDGLENGETSSKEKVVQSDLYLHKEEIGTLNSRA